MPTKQPQRIINALAPIRICDIGGWTDTWFAEHGVVFNIGVSCCVEVQLAVYTADQGEQRIVIHAENYGQRYALDPKALQANQWEKHPLLEAAASLLAQQQQEQGHWLSEDGPEHDVSATLEALYALAGCGLLDES